MKTKHNMTIKNVILHYVPSKILIKRNFRRTLHRKVELKKPLYYNDKLQWLKLNWSDQTATKCADKFAVREVVKSRVGSEYLNGLIAVYDSVEEIDIDSLPNKFVLKATHGSGFNFVCQDKNKVEWPHIFELMKEWMNTDYYLQHREPVYKDIKPKIICEEFLKQDDGDELRDYRFFCFNGVPKFIAVDFNINDKKKTRRNLYDLEWNILDARITYPNEKTQKVKKPTKLAEMLEISRKISAGFPHARIDFYYINNKITFGEITFFHQNGMGIIEPLEFERKMGDYLVLPDLSKSKLRK